MSEKSGNQHDQTVQGFGYEWSKFHHPEEMLQKVYPVFQSYFDSFPWSRLSAESKGIDVGCGTGRWAYWASKKLPKLILFDASVEALERAKINLKAETQVEFIHGDVARIPLPDASLDFAYSLGVLHHVPSIEKALDEIARVLKPGAPFLVYLYYALDGRPLWFKLLWRATDLFRRVISRLPHALRGLVCDAIAFGVYWPVSRLDPRITSHWPLRFYRDQPMYVLRTDALDRFGTQLEKRFKKEDIESLLLAHGFEGVSFSSQAPFWTAICHRKGTHR